MASTQRPPHAEQMIAQAQQHSPFLVRALAARAFLPSQLRTSVGAALGREAMQQFLAQHAAGLEIRLRDLRSWVFAHVLVRDLAQVADLQEVMHTMTTLAELSLAAAHRAAWQTLLERYGEPLDEAGQRQELVIVGMGKLGGLELNVSSDIDLVFLYPAEGQTNGARSLSNFEFFTRMGKMIIRTLDELTAEGRVFRVDMRLRPYGESGPLVCSFEALENYLVTQGRAWERYAWLKARALTGMAWQQQLQAIVHPFVFRKYLDFGAISAMSALHEQIRREVLRQDRAGNIKRGPGGIREIEFIAQVFQLIRAGRMKALQVRPTVQALRVLRARAIIDDSEADALLAAYDFLRRIEHRLQYREDAQTHDLPAPEDNAQWRDLARSMGFDSRADLAAALQAHRDTVSASFEAVFNQPQAAGQTGCAAWSSDRDCMQAALAAAGFADAAAMGARLLALQGSPRYRHMPASLRARFDALMPHVIEAAAKTALPDAALQRALALLEAISGRDAYLALLQQYPDALRRVMDMMAASRHAAQFLAAHPILLDELLDQRTLSEEPDWAQLAAGLAAEMQALGDDTERQMDRMREWLHAAELHFLMQDLAGVLRVERLSDHLSKLADVVLEQVLACVWQHMPNKHCEQARFAVIGYGTLGGKELGYGADLDLVFLFDDAAPAAIDTYSRYARRINTWLSGRTAAGILYETDLRLRPDGDAGLLVSSFDGFRRYQLEHAWRWEHQALTRARFCAGDAALGMRFEALRNEVLSQPRPLAQLRTDIVAMRAKMRREHGGGAAFSLKHDAGGLVDVEFIVQYLVLGYSAQHPELTANLGNITLLGMAAELGLIDSELAAACARSYRQLRRLQHACRLNDLAAPAEVGEATTQPVEALWRAVFGHDGDPPQAATP